MNKDHHRGRRTFLKSGLAALLGARYWQPMAEAMRQGDHPSVHGMLVVGQETVFLSHLPIFGSPHDYQVIIEGTFTKPGSNPQADYFNDRKRTSAKLYTVEPRPFVLTDLSAKTPLRSFKVDLYRGHFERFRTERAKEAARIGQDVDVNVTRVIHFQKFDPKAASMPRLEYFLFGKGNEIFAAHLITKPPDFDQIVSVTPTGQKFSDADLGRGAPIVISGKANTATQRLRPKQVATAQLKTAGSSGATFKLQPNVEFYLEQDELRE
jgi:hypothetical protein